MSKEGWRIPVLKLKWASSDGIRPKAATAPCFDTVQSTSSVRSRLTRAPNVALAISRRAASLKPVRLRVRCVRGIEVEKGGERGDGASMNVSNCRSWVLERSMARNVSQGRLQ